MAAANGEVRYDAFPCPFRRGGAAAHREREVFLDKGMRSGAGDATAKWIHVGCGKQGSPGFFFGKLAILHRNSIP